MTERWWWWWFTSNEVTKPIPRTFKQITNIHNMILYAAFKKSFITLINGQKLNRCFNYHKLLEWTSVHLVVKLFFVLFHTCRNRGRLSSLELFYYVCTTTTRPSIHYAYLFSHWIIISSIHLVVDYVTAITKQKKQTRTHCVSVKQIKSCEWKIYVG